MSKFTVDMSRFAERKDWARHPRDRKAATPSASELLRLIEKQTLGGQWAYGIQPHISVLSGVLGGQYAPPRMPQWAP